MIVYKDKGWFGGGTDPAAKCDSCKWEERFWSYGFPHGWIVVRKPRGKQEHYCCEECAKKGKR